MLGRYELRFYSLSLLLRRIKECTLGVTKVFGLDGWGIWGDLYRGNRANFPYRDISFGEAHRIYPQLGRPQCVDAPGTLGFLNQWGVLRDLARCAIEWMFSYSYATAIPLTSVFGAL